jgi:Rrf2 family protein
MRFSKTTDYALRVMMALALANDKRLSLQYLATNEQIPRKFLEHVVRTLKESDLVHSAPGPKGGYRLNMPASEISVGSIIKSVNGPLMPNNMLEPDFHPEHQQESIRRLQAVVKDIRGFARQRLESLTLSDLAETREMSAHEGLMYYI